MTLQRVVSAHAAAAAAVVLVIRRLESMQSHANSRQAVVVHASCASAGPNAGQRQGRAGPSRACSVVHQSCSDIAVEGGEREKITVRRRGQLE